MTDDWLVVGKIVAAQGLKGEVRVNSYSDFPERFLQAGKRWVRADDKDMPQPIELISGRNLPSKNNIYIVQFADVNNRDQAEALCGKVLLVPESDRPQLLDNEYHVTDLIGCDVFHQPSGKYLGKVKDVMAAGNDLLEVENEQHQQVLIPFVMEIVPIVDLAQKRIEVLPPNGLLEKFEF